MTRQWFCFVFAQIEYIWREHFLFRKLELREQDHLDLSDSRLKRQPEDVGESEEVSFYYTFWVWDFGIHTF